MRCWKRRSSTGHKLPLNSNDQRRFKTAQGREPRSLPSPAVTAMKKLRSRLSLNVQRARISICRKLWQGTAGQVDIEGHNVSAAGVLVRAGNGNIRHLVAGIRAAEGNRAGQRSGRAAVISNKESRRWNVV